LRLLGNVLTFGLSRHAMQEPDIAFAIFRAMSCPHSAIAASDDHIRITRISFRADAPLSGTGCCFGSGNEAG
jgi:hypothetical protein